MVRNNRTMAALSIAAALAMVATACSTTPSSSNNGQAGSSSSSAQTANINATGNPKKGGTLKIVGNADVDHLDTAGGYYTATYTLMRAYTRQLFS